MTSAATHNTIKQANPARAGRRLLVAGRWAGVFAAHCRHCDARKPGPGFRAAPDTAPSDSAQTLPAGTACGNAAGGIDPEGPEPALELMDVKVTTVTRTESTVGQSPAAVSVITQEMIQRSGATVIPELFRMVPGMDVSQVNANEWAVGARGFSSVYGGPFENKLLVQMDGRTLYNPDLFLQGVYWDNVDYPLNDIERIEVIRGPGGSVWGANAVDGVINIITKPAQETCKAELRQRCRGRDRRSRLRRSPGYGGGDRR